MSHTHHRSGNDESLRYDYVFVSLPAKGINREGSGPKMCEIAKIFSKHNPNNSALDKWEGKMTPDATSEMFKDKQSYSAHAVLTSDEDLVACLKELKEADWGISVVVSGLFGHVHECCRKAGVEPHTVNTSLGVWGNTSLLPEQGVRDISTMCGHGMITFGVIKDCVEKIKAGKLDAQAAAERVRPLCTCGILNIDRAVKIFNELASC